MNKKQIIASLNKIANELDNTGLYTEANTVTKVMSRLAYDDFDERDYYNDKMDGMDLMREDYMPYGDEDDDMDMEDENYSGNGLTEGLDEISSMMDMHGNHPADKLREDYSRDYNNPSRSEMGDVFRDLDELVVENMTMNREQKNRYEEIKNQLMNSLG